MLLALVAQWQRIHLPMQEMGFDPWVRKIPWSRKWQPTPVFCLENFNRGALRATDHEWSHTSSETAATEHPHNFLHRLSCFQIKSFTSTSIILMDVLLPLSCLVALKLPVKHWTEFMTVDILALFLITSITLAVGLFINALDWVKEVPSHLLVCWEFLARMGIDFVKCFLYTYWKNHVIFH